MIKVAPSLLAADYMRLGEEIRRMAAAGADWLHFDVMDGSFVPNISFGPELCRQAAGCGLPVDAHLMIVNPEKYIAAFAQAGARLITVHAEAATHLHRCLHEIREAGCLAGVALNPATSPECLRYVLGDFDLALVMTVNPGYGGQRLISHCVRKVSDVRRMLSEAGCEAIVEVDGGVNLATAPELIAAGADMLVTGSAVYGAPDAAAFIRALKGAAGSAAE
ncbi:MAG: ribulose-phosphate 3-epimerase [Clostridia bacterium]|nr:ribulose-phosphate 3-epimerase [Clostridia bacterium]